MKFHNLLILLFTCIFSSAHAEIRSDSNSMSCSDTIELCTKTDDKITCEDKYFYIYTYQYVQINNGKISSESHSFSASGAFQEFSKDETRTQVGLSADWIVYETKDFKLAVPFTKESKMFLKQKHKKTALIDGPLNNIDDVSIKNEWQEICPKKS